jgi:hypothetical protein
VCGEVHLTLEHEEGVFVVVQVINISRVVTELASGWRNLDCCRQRARRIPRVELFVAIIVVPDEHDETADELDLGGAVFSTVIVVFNRINDTRRRVDLGEATATPRVDVAAEVVHGVTGVES